MSEIEASPVTVVNMSEIEESNASTHTKAALLIDWEFVKESLKRGSGNISSFPHIGAGLPLSFPQPHVWLSEDLFDGEQDGEQEKFNVEFLWGDNEKAKDVKIAGSWDEWRVSQMTKGESKFVRIVRVCIAY